MPVATHAEIAAPIETVWEIISDFAGIERWHPLLKSAQTVGEGEGAIRILHFADWWAAERLDRLDHADHSLSYTLVGSSRRAIENVAGTMRLDALGPNLTRLEWVSGFDDDSVPHAGGVHQMLEAYYPVRIGHLRDALLRGVAA